MEGSIWVPGILTLIKSSFILYYWIGWRPKHTCIFISFSPYLYAKNYEHTWIPHAPSPHMHSSFLNNKHGFMIIHVIIFFLLCSQTFVVLAKYARKACVLVTVWLLWRDVMTMAALMEGSICLGLAYNVRDLVHYHHGKEHGSAQVDTSWRNSWELYILICRR